MFRQFFSLIALFVFFSLTWTVLLSEPMPSESVAPPRQVMTYTTYLPQVVTSNCNYTDPVRGYLQIINVTSSWSNCGEMGRGIKVAIIDTGLDIDHPDLAANITGGVNTIDLTLSYDDDNGHGSHVAGLVAGVPNNGGIIGVAPQASLLGVKALNADGGGTVLDLVQGIRWAIDNDAQIINLSLTTFSSSNAIFTALQEADAAGILLIAAAGNCGGSLYATNGCPSEDAVAYPGAYSNVIAVGATDFRRMKASYSTTGYYVELMAQGSSIYSSYSNGTYQELTGTSYAAPQVAGFAALLWAENRGLTHDQVRAIMRQTVTDLGKMMPMAMA